MDASEEIRRQYESLFQRAIAESKNLSLELARDIVGPAFDRLSDIVEHSRVASMWLMTEPGHRFQVYLSLKVRTPSVTQEDADGVYRKMTPTQREELQEYLSSYYPEREGE